MRTPPRSNLNENIKMPHWVGEDVIKINKKDEIINPKRGRKIQSQTDVALNEDTPEPEGSVSPVRISDSRPMSIIRNRRS